MTRRSAPLQTDRIRRRITPLPRTAVDRDEPARPAQRIEVAHMALLVWWGLLILSQAVVPPADGANAEVLGALDGVVLLGMVGAVFATTLLLGQGHRGGGHAALWGGAFFFGAAVACPITDHHALAGWWYVQLAATAGMMATGAWALRRGRR